MTTIICLALKLYLLVLIVRILLSWVPSLPDPVRPLVRGLHAVTDPVLVPLRRVLPPLQMGAMAFDLSPIIVFFGIYLLQIIFRCPPSLF